MKNLILFLTLSLMMSLVTCRNKTETTKDGDAKTDSTSNPSPPSPPAKITADPTCKYCVAENSEDHSIKFSEVQSMMINYNYEKFESISNCGGVFRANDIVGVVDSFEQKNNLIDVSTLCFYPILRVGADPSTTTLSLAAEVKNCEEAIASCGDHFEDPAANLEIPGPTSLIRNILRADLVNPNVLKKYLRGTNFGNNVTNQNVLASTLTNQMSDFRQHFQNNHPSPLTAFGRSKSFTQMSTPVTPAYFIFFFGWDYSQEPKVDAQNNVLEAPHSLRVIFGALDGTGKLIVPNNDWDKAFRESSRPRRP